MVFVLRGSLIHQGIGVTEQYLRDFKCGSEGFCWFTVLDLTSLLS